MMYCKCAIAQIYYNVFYKINFFEVFMKLKHLFFSGLGVLMLTCAAAPRTTTEQLLRVGPWNAAVNIPSVKTAPEIDGVFSAGEWDSAAQISGFSRLGGDHVTSGTGTLSLMRDTEFLYLALRTTTPNNHPGGSLAANIKSRDG